MQSLKNHYHWKGGITNYRGYQFKAMGHGKRMPLHRYLYERHYKVKLNSDDIIHHENGIKNDNRIKNLVLVKRSEHATLHDNSKIRRYRDRLIMGVYWIKRLKKWRAVVGENYKHIHLGLFKNENEARMIRCQFIESLR